MKKLIYIMSTALLVSCGQTTEQSQEQPTVSSDKNYIAVYDFHTEHRCETCLAIEAATTKTLNSNFQDEMDDKIITFNLINADAKKNQKLAEEYGAFGTTLALTLFKGEEKEIIDITNWAFDAVHGDNFEKELTAKINDALAKL
jgi:hypothetical protein